MVPKGRLDTVSMGTKLDNIILQLSWPYDFYPCLTTKASVRLDDHWLYCVTKSFSVSEPCPKQKYSILHQFVSIKDPIWEYDLVPHLPHRPCKRHPPDPPSAIPNSFNPISHMLGKMMPWVLWKYSRDVHPGHSFPPKRYSFATGKINVLHPPLCFCRMGKFGHGFPPAAYSGLL